MKRHKTLPQKRKDGRIRCESCGRLFLPSRGNTTCLLCQNGLMVNPPLQHQQPKPAEAAETSETTGGKRRKKKFWIPCNKCDKFFWSTSKVYNRICPNCTSANANISILATPNSQGKLSDFNN
ncbi:MAG: hypothetical protein NTX82_02775 [Candidatus Parcubacteria bacterium]|nr:hypothetical protein [Candidatus Parcubacteria bacterium]